MTRALNIGLVCWACLQCAQASAQANNVAGEAGSSAVAVVAQLQDALVEAADLKDVHARFDLLKDVVAATHDLDFIGELTVRREWRDWTEQQRAAFLAAFRSLSIMNYAARFANVDEESFEIIAPQLAGNERIEVKTTVVRADGSTVPLDFVLQKAGEQWRIVNILADGVSDLALKRAEYRSLLGERGFDGLVGEIEAQTRAMAQKSDG